jgi:serine/threonine protein kinase
VLSRLRHPGLVGLRDSGTHRGDPFLVLDLVEGSDLASVLRHGPLGADGTATLLLPVAEGLAHAHATGVVHRDVKPANILVDQDGRGRLADFGIARLAGATRYTATGRVIGTAVYLAPEQVRAEPVGPAADVYALGLVILECATGVRAFPGGAVESAMARLMRTPALPVWLSPWMRQLLQAMTAMQPGLRPGAAEVAETLRRSGADGALPDRDPTAAYVLATEMLAASSTTATASPYAAVGHGRLCRARAAWLAVVAAAVLLVAGSLAVVAHRRPTSVPMTTIPGPSAVTSATAPITSMTTTSLPPTRTAPSASTTSIVERQTRSWPKPGKPKDSYGDWQSDD